MTILQNLTPFSQSVLLPAAALALRRAAQRLGVDDFTVSQSALSVPHGVNARLADLTLAHWGASAPAIAQLLGASPTVGVSPGKAGRGLKTAQQLFGDFSQTYGRLRRWSEWVFASQWSQAQLLQVMEEIEPMVAEALLWDYLLAVTATGSYAHLGRQLLKFEKQHDRAHALRLALTAGLETPQGRLIAMLSLGASPERLKAEFGHMAVWSDGELALPRVAEMAETLIGASPAPESLTWDLSRAQGRQEEAMREAMAAAGFLGRSGLRKRIEITQSALIAHAKARDALAYVLAATRHWAQAAAAEGMSDGRIQQEAEIFMLEIEEIKQMMTGEWHDRERIAPLIAGRQHGRRSAPNAATDVGVGPLGVAGRPVQGELLSLRSPDDVMSPSGFIALADDWSPVWWRALLMAEGVLTPAGNLLDWIAAVARMGDLSTLVGCTECATWPDHAVISLDPGRNRAEMLD